MLLLIEYYKKYLETKKIVITKNILRWTNKYKENTDIYLKFLTECTREADTHVRTSLLYESFKKWFVLSTLRIDIPSDKEFIANLRKHKTVQKIRSYNSAVNGVKNLKIVNNNNIDENKWIDICNKIHDNKYDYSQINYINCETAVIIICSIHGNFELVAGIHMSKHQGCPKCKACPSCLLWNTRGKLCDYCLPLNRNKLYKKTKEMKVVTFLKENLPDKDFIHNKSVGKNCTDGHLFPDILFDCEFYFLIVEIDEHKHRGANYACDERRMYDIIAKLGMPCIFIRYNPDGKDSDENELLEKIKEYLEIDLEDEKIWDDYGFYTEYLFY